MRPILLVLLPGLLYGQSAVRINVGGPDYTDGGGNVYAADSGCSSSTTFARGGAIANTLDPTLYQTGRSDSNSVGCSYTVDNFAFYYVTVRFAETDPLVTRIGQRIMNVFVNGVIQYAALDILGVSRQHDTAVDLSFGPIPVSTGIVAILVTTVTGGPVLQALSIVQASSGGGGTGDANNQYCPVAFSATLSIDTSQTLSGARCGTFAVPMTGNVSSFAFTNGATTRAKFTTKFTQDGTGSRTISGIAGNISGMCGIAVDINKDTWIEWEFDGTTYRQKSCTTNGTPTTQDVPTGGTGVTSLTNHGVVIGAGTSPVNVTGPGTAGYVLTSNGGAADPSMQPSTGGPVIALVQTVQSAHAVSPNAQAITWGTGHLATVVIVDDTQNNTVTSVVGSSSGAWTQACTVAVGATRLDIWYKANATAGADTVTVTLSAGAGGFWQVLGEWSGATTTTPLDSCNAVSSTSSAANPYLTTGLITVTNSNVLSVGTALIGSDGPGPYLLGFGSSTLNFTSTYGYLGPAGIYRFRAYAAGAVTAAIVAAQFH